MNEGLCLPATRVAATSDMSAFWTLFTANRQGTRWRRC